MGGTRPESPFLGLGMACKWLLCSLHYYQMSNIEHPTGGDSEEDLQASQQRKFQKELNAGIVSLVLLSILAGAKEPLYGYQIAKQLERDGAGTAIMKQGTLYPVLR